MTPCTRRHARCQRRRCRLTQSVDTQAGEDTPKTKHKKSKGKGKGKEKSESEAEEAALTIAIYVLRLSMIFKNFQKGSVGQPSYTMSIEVGSRCK